MAIIIAGPIIAERFGFPSLIDLIFLGMLVGPFVLDRVYDGTATYGIIDQDGTLRIATVSWTGVQAKPDDYAPSS